MLEAPYELPRREDEEGDQVVFTGRVTGEDGEPLAGAELDVWHADAKGLYSGFDPSLPEGILRGKVLTGADGRYEVRTIVPAPYTIPEDGPTGAMVHAAGWSPWRPAHIHLIVERRGPHAARHPALHRLERLPRQRRGRRGEGRAHRASPSAGTTAGFTYDYEFKLRAGEGSGERLTEVP